MNVTKFSIYGLFGTQDVIVPIRDNKLVIVGVNGIGKSTLLNIFYYFISLRWSKLKEFKFDRIEITLNNKKLRLHQKELNKGLIERKWLLNYLPSSLIRKIEEDSDIEFYAALTDHNTSKSILDKIAMRTGIPSSVLSRIKQNFSAQFETTQDLFPDDARNLIEVRKALSEEINGAILFLPTYRRIEKDLSAVVPDIEEKVKEYEDRSSRNFTRHSSSEKAQKASASYIDLVQFGMADVSNLIQFTIGSIDEFARQKLNELAGVYLREVIRGEVHNFNIETISSYSEDEIRAIMDRVSEGSLSISDKKILQGTIQRIQKNPGAVTEQDKYAAHYFAKIVEFVRSVEKLEEPIRSFMRVCNEKYLINKRLVYDAKNYTFSVVRTGHSSEEINLKNLSSGEKQVVSLFCHLYLTPPKSFIILIDEPELSLSVDWQLSLLPDILSSGKCGFIFAVTHSPFIYENSLEAHALDLRKHIRYLASSNA